MSVADRLTGESLRTALPLRLEPVRLGRGLISALILTGGKLGRTLIPEYRVARPRQNGMGLPSGRPDREACEEGIQGGM